MVVRVARKQVLVQLDDRLVDSKISATGVFMGTYEPAGDVVTGSF